MGHHGVEADKNTHPAGVFGGKLVKKALVHVVAAAHQNQLNARQHNVFGHMAHQIQPLVADKPGHHADERLVVFFQLKHLPQCRFAGGFACFKRVAVVIFGKGRVGGRVVNFGVDAV
ncbi:hypothetical protein SDC9_191325 [bioreactor metagenome]|uniref:Uncharacterized protein n=1 Tax=bioreactor metagenome TaxID=1076179 RepID=A0A645HXK3_9ZZZZ